MKRIYHEAKRKGLEDNGVEVSVYKAFCKRDTVGIKIIILNTWWDHSEGHERVFTFRHEFDSFVIREAIRLFDAMVKAHPNL